MDVTLMTGATRGLGRVAAEHLLRTRRDRHLVVFARSGDPAAELAKATGNRNVSTIRCDLKSFDSIRAAVADLRERDLGPITGFLANAGVQEASTDTATADGLETTFAVNVLANHLLLTLLRDDFAQPCRIVVVGSDVHDPAHNSMGVVPPPVWTDARDLATPRPGGARDGRRAYATSKLGVLYLVHAHRRRLPEDVDIYTYNPGHVPNTGLLRNVPPVGRAVAQGVGVVLAMVSPRSTMPGPAGRLMAAALDGPRPGESGVYVNKGVVVPSSDESYDREREERLITVADALCGIVRA
ncbi:hypothetical protein GCM10022243_18170 [Saccharothrix violaceirubra]|uniref:NAD(P)-dependent dehydrogenase (Short-subunit alcohol dehydrogenase family) n=1 Tax=Saccharothrix violaceirubra TaxID=413306 RepID=A0A7W7T2A3_9PSEU|nr:SDR family NAD(P)-dependent oxidoreductase [Saccharothrix violaceirubra]MBB4965275.1 NAD(P)-dependent dehydrogenase (short-subunit alcohol dehydrogenase family) [Saccharothrix violaceirubra]